MSEFKSRKGCAHACERCQKSKVRCSTDTLREHGKCKRCYQAGTECTFVPTKLPQQRRRRTDARITVLEQRLKAMDDTLTFQDHVGLRKSSDDQFIHSDSTGITRGPKRGAVQDQAEVLTVNDGSSLANNRGNRCSPRGSPDATSPAAHDDNSDPIPGLILSTTLTMSEAVSIFSKFTAHILPEFPLIHLGVDDTFAKLRLRKPLLLFAIITAASRAHKPSVFVSLHKELQQAVVDRVILQGQRSLELIQVVLMLEHWYHTPMDLSRLNFYQWVSIASSMAVHLGLVGGRQLSQSLRKDENKPPTAQETETWRTVLAVCIISSMVAVSMQRRAVLTVKCDALETLHQFEACSITSSDRRLVEWSKLQLMAEEVESSKMKFHTVYSKATFKSDLRSLETRFDTWRQSQKPDIMNGSLETMYMYCRCKLYELALIGCEVTPLPQTSLPSPGSRDTISEYNVQKKVTPAVVKAITSILQCCQQLLSNFNHFDITYWLVLPTVTTVRAVHAINMLAALSNLARKPQSVISQVIDEDMIQLETYLLRLKSFMEKAVDVDADNMPKLVLNLLDRISEQPYAAQSQAPSLNLPSDCPYSDSIVDGTPRNDFEEVVVSSVSQTGNVEKTQFLNEQQQIVDTIQQPMTEQSIDTATFNHVVQQEQNIYGNSILDSTMVCDYAVMCMPDFLSRPELWFGNHDGGSQHLATYSNLTDMDTDFSFNGWN